MLFGWGADSLIALQAQGRRKPARRSSNSAQAKAGNLSSVDEDEEDEDEPMPEVKPARKAANKASGSFDPFGRKRDAAAAGMDNKSKVEKKVKVVSKAKPQVKAVKVEHKPEPVEEDVKPKIKAETEPEPLSARALLQQIKAKYGISPGVKAKEIFAANG